MLITRTELFVIVSLQYILYSSADIGLQPNTHANSRNDDKYNKGDKECLALNNRLTDLNVQNEQHHIQSTKIFVSNLEICNNHARSCCNHKTERKLKSLAQTDLQENLDRVLSNLHSLFTNNQQHYQDQFMKMLETAENNAKSVLNNMYKIGQQNWKSCLDDLFLDLSSYLRRKDVDISESVTRFYDQLFVVIYQFVLNDPSVASFDPDYKDCLIEARQDLTPQPFGDVPAKLAHNLSEAFHAARMLLQALDLGIETMNKTSNVALENGCLVALTRFTSCSLCDDLDDVRPCRPFCSNVMRGCLAGVVELDRHWNYFVDGLQSLGRSMVGVRDLEVVLNSFHTRVSDSIMHSMATTHKYYPKILSQCGHPKNTKDGQKHDNMRVPDMSNFHPLPTRPPTKNTRSKLASKIEMFLRNVFTSKGILAKLPDSVCSLDGFTSSAAESCWNGTSVGLYKRHVPVNIFAAQTSDNPEMTVSSAQYTTLSSLAKKLDEAVKEITGIVGDEELMQSDAAFIDYNHMQGSGENGFADDEDHDSDGSGGSGDDEDDDEDQAKPPPVMPKNKNKQGGKQGHSNTDFEFTADKVTRKQPSPYVTHSNQISKNGQGSSNAVRSSLVVVCIMSLFSPLAQAH